jgi:hypothetical protein
VASNISGDVGGRPDVTNAGSLYVAGALGSAAVGVSASLWLQPRGCGCEVGHGRMCGRQPR